MKISRTANVYLGLVAAAFTAACSTSPDKVCESPYAQSPQYKGCGFRNMDNPDALPSQSTLKIYSRMLHNSTFDLAFHRWQDPLERLAALAERNNIELATPLIGEVLTVGQARTNVQWWKNLR